MKFPHCTVVCWHADFLREINFLIFPLFSGNDAEALRDILIHRLESQTESVSLKIAILKFFTANAKTQPGLIQLLLSQDQGCLKSVINLLKSLKTSP